MQADRSAIFAVVVCTSLSALLALGHANTQEIAVRTTDAAILRVDRNSTRIVLSGDLSSAAHETILRQTAQRLFPQEEHIFDLHYRTPLPAGWALVTELSLRALSYTYSATASIGADRVTVRGVTGNFADWQHAAARLRNSLLPGMHYEEQVVEIANSATLQEHCDALLKSALGGRSIRFQQGSDVISPAAYAWLDELIQISADCPAARFVITGHADPSGEQSDGVSLSESRARNVLAYIASRGIAAGRLQAIGAGSARPLQQADNNHARQENRRVDLQAVFP